MLGEFRIRETQTGVIPPAPDRTYKFGREATISSGSKNECLGSFEVLHVQERTIAVQNTETSVHKACNSFQAKTYYRDFRHNFHTFKSSNNIIHVMIIVPQVIQSHDPSSQYFKNKNQKETEELKKSKTWEPILKTSLH